jgi:hypothetical protein
MTTMSVLNREQLGHLRHWDNLSRQLPHDWSLMQGKGLGEDDFGSYRFQLAYMMYGLALTHRHRLPAAPGVFQPTVQRLMDKLLMPEVWMYWRDTSQGGAVVNAHISEGLGEEWDPVVRDNIMYSAYVQSCALLHDYLFASDRYAASGSLTFKHWSYFWGGQEKRFSYDRDSLNDHLYWQMVQNGYLGVACEPNCVFQICNQPAIMGFRMHDLITGGERAREVVDGYEKAWADFGRLDADGHYNMFMMEDSRTIIPNDGRAPWIDAWCGALMNSWNRDFVRENYPRQIGDFLIPGPEGTISVRPSPPMAAMGQDVIVDTCDTGWVAAWVSEMGDQATLDGIFGHTDRFMNPTWRDGGLYYPRNDTPVDAEGNRTEIEPMTGNVLLGYARLNVPDGIWGLYNQPWGSEHHTEPALVEVERDVEVSRAEVIDGVLHARLRRDRILAGSGTVTLARLPDGARLRLDGAEITGRAEGNQVVLDVPDGPAMDLIAAP